MAAATTSDDLKTRKALELGVEQKSILRFIPIKFLMKYNLLGFEISAGLNMTAKFHYRVNKKTANVCA